MNRVRNWESILDSAIATFDGLPYKYGATDCFHFSFYVIREITGRDYFKELSIPPYDSKLGAAKILADRYNGSVLGLVDSVAHRSDAKTPARGNLVATPVDDGWSIGVWAYPVAKFVTDVGLINVRKSDIKVCWDI